MADADLLSQYRSVGRGRGILGLKEYIPCKRPGILSGAATNTNTNNSAPLEEKKQEVKSLIVRHNYQANPESPGGFKELSILKGQILKFVDKHPSNEHWWEVENEEGENGFVPASYVIYKDTSNLPWLEGKVIQSAEEERKERVLRLNQEKSYQEGRGFGPPPLGSSAHSSFGHAVAAIKRQSSEDYNCDLCGKRFNGPIPYRMHLASKAHREEEEDRRRKNY